MTVELTGRRGRALLPSRARKIKEVRGVEAMGNRSILGHSGVSLLHLLVGVFFYKHLRVVGARASDSLSSPPLFSICYSPA